MPTFRSASCQRVRNFSDDTDSLFVIRLVRPLDPCAGSTYVRHGKYFRLLYAYSNEVACQPALRMAHLHMMLQQYCTAVYSGVEMLSNGKERRRNTPPRASSASVTFAPFSGSWSLRAIPRTTPTMRWSTRWQSVVDFSGELKGWLCEIAAE